LEAKVSDYQRFPRVVAAIFPQVFVVFALLPIMAFAAYAPSQRAEVVFVDSGVDDYQTLMRGVRAGAEVVVIDRQGDGMKEIAAHLRGRSGIDAVHIVSHGSVGQLRLGRSILSDVTLGRYAAELASLRAALNPGADLLLYGCHAGAEGRGEAFIDAVAAATGADVAGSSDLTGATDLGGDWDLEYAIGKVETDLAFDDAALQAFEGALPVFDFVSNSPSGDNTDTVTQTIDGDTLTATTLGRFDISSGTLGVRVNEAESFTVTLNGGGPFTFGSLAWKDSSAAEYRITGQRVDGGTDQTTFTVNSSADTGGVPSTVFPNTYTSLVFDEVSNDGSIDLFIDSIVLTAADTTPPAAPSTPDLDPVSDTGSSNTDDITGDTTPTFTGTGETDATVTLFSDVNANGALDGGESVGTAVVAGGAWSITSISLTDGTYNIRAIQTDTAGNASTASAALSTTIDTLTPTVALPDLTDATDTGISNTDDETNNATPTITGTTEAGATVSVRIGGASVGTTTADGSGNWSFTFAPSVLSEGFNAVDIIASDAVNTSNDSADLTIDLDTTNPILSAVDLVDASDTGSSNTDEITSDATPTIEYTAENVASVAVDWGDDNGFVAAAAGTGAAQQATLSTAYGNDGTPTLTVRATDRAGNESTETLALTIDMTAPRLAASTRQNPTAAATNAASVTFRADFGEVVEGVAADDFAVSGTAAGSASIGSVTPQGSGVFDVTVTGLGGSEGTINLDLAGGVSITDLAGNTLADGGVSGADETYVLDNTAPVVGVDSLLTDDSTPALSGTVDDADASLVVAVGGQTAVPVNNGDGTWSLTDNNLAPLANGVYDLVVTATDPAGNAAVDSSVDELTIAPDTDGDGVDNAVENGAPNGGDGNDDGIPDAEQSDVTSLLTSTGRGYMTVSVSAGCSTLEEVVAVAPASLPTDPSGRDYSFGLVEFVLPCESAEVSVIFHDATDAEFSRSTYRKYGPITPGDSSTIDWYDFSEFASNTGNTWVLSLADNRLGDDTGDDGRILDQGGPSTELGDGSAVPIPLNHHWAMLMLMALLLLAGIRGVAVRNGSAP
jgi:hypothetical protein